MSIKLKIPPAAEPLSLTEAKAYLRITDANDDTIITAMIGAVRQQCEEYTKRALVTQTWELWMDSFPCGETPKTDGYFETRQLSMVRRLINIPRPPLRSVASLITYDAAGIATVFPVTHYFVDTASEPGRIALNSNQMWPLALREYNAAQIEFVAGYGDTAASVPNALKQGMLFLLKILFADKAKAFETDEPHSLGGLNDKLLPPIVKGLWNPYRVMSL